MQTFPFIITRLLSLETAILTVFYLDWLDICTARQAVKEQFLEYEVGSVIILRNRIEVSMSKLEFDSTRSKFKACHQVYQSDRSIGLLNHIKPLPLHFNEEYDASDTTRSPYVRL